MLLWAIVPTRTDSAEAAGTIDYAELGEISLCYEELGDGRGEPLILIMGLGMQMIAWDEGFCEQLTGRGFRVIRFDNRDVGLSSKLAGRRVNLTAGLLGLTRSAAYDLDDMAADTVGLLDHLGLERAHLVGASLGGMIAQQVAALHPERVASLSSIMSGTGRRRPSRMPRPRLLAMLLRSPPPSREDFVEDIVDVFRRIGSPAYPTDVDSLRERAARSYDRCFYPAGTARQLMAVMASGNRTPQLHFIDAPSLVIHGTADRLLPPRAGRDTAAAIPGARLELIEGMGHDLPVQLWPRFAELIEANAARS
jgi:pimeloyl-ACP methyl ester carboxylesterase